MKFIGTSTHAWACPQRSQSWTLFQFSRATRAWTLFSLNFSSLLPWWWGQEVRLGVVIMGGLTSVLAFWQRHASACKLKNRLRFQSTRGLGKLKGRSLHWCTSWGLQDLGPRLNKQRAVGSVSVLIFSFLILQSWLAYILKFEVRLLGLGAIACGVCVYVGCRV